MKTKHTHQGTCQACGAVQAVNNVTQLVAKHGYQVVGFHFFNGVCQGSGHKPAELEVLLTYKIIDSCIAWALDADRCAALYASRTIMLVCWEKQVYEYNPRKARNMYVRKSYPMFGCSDVQIDREYKHAVEGQEQQAEKARSHAQSLRDNVLTRLGKPLFPVQHKTLRQFAAGDVVKLNGRDFKLLSPRYGMRGGAVKYWKGEFVDAPGKYFTPTIRTLRSQNP